MRIHQLAGPLVRFFGPDARKGANRDLWLATAMTVGPFDPQTQARGTAHPAPLDGSTATMPPPIYQRVVRIVSYLFIAAVAAVSLISSPLQVDVYFLLVVGIVLLVFFQDILPPDSLPRWRLRLEGLAVLVFLTVLLILTGGYASPFFFGFILLLGAGSLWATGFRPLILTIVTIAAYLLAVVVATNPTLLTPDAAGRVVFNVVALVLVAYVAWVVGREQRRAREAALRLSRFDSLTGLYSRSFVVSTVEREIPRAARTGRPFALLMIDLDGLKAANDRFGHESGDRLLHAVADILRADIRATDVAARYAGDEFVVLLPETDLAGALHVAENVRDDIARLALPYDGSLVRSTVSIGVATYPEDGRTWPDLIRRADSAMYEAKRRGRDQIVHYARETATSRIGSVPPIAAAPSVTPPIASQPVEQQSGASLRRPVGPGPQPGAPQFGGATPVPAESPEPAPWETRPA